MMSPLRLRKSVSHESLARGAAPLYGADLLEHLVFPRTIFALYTDRHSAAVAAQREHNLARTGARQLSRRPAHDQATVGHVVSQDCAEPYTNAHVPEARSISMPERRTFAPLHPTTRTFVSAGIERDPLPKELRELVE